jgi:hypothetical protein
MGCCVNNGEVIRPIALSQHFKADKARVRTAGRAVLPEYRDGLSRGRW